jgi:hypothetical protein
MSLKLFNDEVRPFVSLHVIRDLFLSECSMGEAFCFGFDVGSEDLVIKFVLLFFDEVLLIEFLMDRSRGGKVAMMSWFPGLSEFA